jgi:di/tricarboxylate transporter
MSWDAWLTLGIVVLTVTAMARDWVAPVIAVLGAVIVLLVAGVISTDQAFSGFANPAPITVAALFVVARAVEKTGALQPLVTATLGKGDSGRVGLARLIFPTAAASAFLNNTPIVAMLAPQVAEWARKHGKAASWFLMPLSFATILGGTLTLIGTSTNLVVSGLLEASGYEPLGMFELTQIGLPLAVVGLGLIVLLAPVLLPDRRPARQQFEEEIREFVLHQRVSPEGALDGLTVEAAGLRHLEGVFLTEIERDGQVIAPAAPTTLLRGGDRLMFVGRVDRIRDLQTTRGLVSAEEKHVSAFTGIDHTYFEAVISGASPLVGNTLREASFRSRYQAAVLAIHRAGARVDAKLGEVKLKAGDTLLIASDREFARRWRNRSEFLLVAHLGGTRAIGMKRAWLAVAVALAIVTTAGLGLLPIVHAALLGAVLLVVGGALTPGEAKNAVDLDVVVLIAAAFGIGAAIAGSGLANLLGNSVVSGLGGFGPLAVLLALTVATIVLTELITNNAAAVLVFPIAVAAAAELGLDPRPFVVGITVAASASFLTPIGYQTNTMVYGLGGYRFGDYARLGAPLTATVILTIVVFVPLFWPF